MIGKSMIFFAMVLSSNTLLAAESFDLEVVVAGVSPQQGQVVVSLFNEKNKWLEKPAQVEKKDVNESETVEVYFRGLEAGTYALSVFHDEDGNGQMATRMFGIPAEPVGFSNDARRKFGPAKWKQASFELTEDTSLTVNLVRIGD